MGSPVTEFSGEAVDDKDEWSDYTEDNRSTYATVPLKNWNTVIGTLLAPSVGGEAQSLEPEQPLSGGDGLDVGHAKRQEQALGTACCPWKKIINPQSTQEVKQESEEKTAFKNPESKNQTYIPPALRQSQGDCRQRPQEEKGPRKLPSAMPMGKPQAPDLQSSTYFPSLNCSLKRHPK